MIVLLIAILAGGFAAVSAARVAIAYNRLIGSMKMMKEEAIAGLPVQIREALSSRWAGSWQSAVFHEVAVGDVSWAATLSITLSSSVDSVRRQFRLMMCSFAGVAAALLIQIVSR